MSPPLVAEGCSLQIHQVKFLIMPHHSIDEFGGMIFVLMRIPVYLLFRILGRTNRTNHAKPRLCVRQSTPLGCVSLTPPLPRDVLELHAGRTDLHPQLRRARPASVGGREGACGGGEGDDG